jgi:hypothetical protein
LICVTAPEISPLMPSRIWSMRRSSALKRAVIDWAEEMAA